MEKLRTQKLIAFVKILAKPKGMTIDDVAKVVMKDYTAENTQAILVMLNEAVKKSLVYKLKSSYLPISASPILMSSSHKKKFSISRTHKCIRRVTKDKLNVGNKTRDRESPMKKSRKKTTLHRQIENTETPAGKPKRLQRTSTGVWVRIKSE